MKDIIEGYFLLKDKLILNSKLNEYNKTRMKIFERRKKNVIKILTLFNQDLAKLILREVHVA